MLLKSNSFAGDASAVPLERIASPAKGSPESERDLEAPQFLESDSDIFGTGLSPRQASCWIVKTKHGDQHILDVVTDPNNWRAGITVALVSIPLSISLGIASGSTPMRGIATAVFGGLSAAFLGGSDYNIVGPAGALSGMLMAYSTKWTDDVLPYMCFLSALFILVVIAFKLHVYVSLVPTPVFEGFTLAVAAIIGLGQINFACGVFPTIKHEQFIYNVYESISMLGDLKVPSLSLFLLQTILLLVLSKKYPKIPWTVIVPALSIPLGWLCEADYLPVDLLTLKSKYGNLEPNLISPPASFRSVVHFDLVPFVLNSCGVGLVAVLETLISAKIASSRVERPFDEVAELRGLALAHLTCGLAGALPPTGVFVRTALNTSLGATHRFAQFLNATVVGIIALIFMPVFLYLPQATIAAILTVAAVRMAPWEYLVMLSRCCQGSLCLCLFTAFVCVWSDPVVGLAVGTCLDQMRGLGVAHFGWRRPKV